MFANLDRDEFIRLLERLGLADHLPALDNRQFAPPPRAGDQLSLL